MDKKRSMMLRVLLNRYHGRDLTSVLKILPEKESEGVLKISLESGNFDPLLKPPKNLFHNVHYSWLIPVMQKIEENKRPLILSLLPEPTASRMREALKDTSEPLALTAQGTSFFLQQFYRLFTFEKILPLDYLPETSMSFLARLSKNDLVDIIDFLGLYDLAEEIQHIVDKHLLGQIYNSLTRKKQLFLNKCLHQKEKLVTQRLKLEHWDGDAQKIKKLLHHKGIVRLGYALSGEHKDLIWHITHILDTGRGEKLSRYCSKEPIPSVTEALQKQIHNVIKFFKQTGEK